MRYLKSVVAGLAGAVLALAAVVLAEIIVVFGPQLWQPSIGGGGIGAVSGAIDVPLSAAAVGFIAGFLLHRTRSARSQRT
jgi:hypothetical protein